MVMADANTAANMAQQATIGSLLSPIEPELQADAAAYGNYQTQLGAIPAQEQQADAYASGMAGIQGQELGISTQQLGLQGASLQAQEGLASQQQGIESQQYGLAMSQYPEQQAEQALSYQNSQQSLQGGLAATGTLNTAGSKTQQSTLAQQNQWANQDINRNQQQAQLGQQSEQAGYQYQEGEFANSQSNLALMAQSNGLSQEQLTDQLNYGIAQNKDSGISSAGQLLAQMGSLAAGDISTAGVATALIAYSGGVNPLAPAAGAG